jgi:hypothetical protein
MTLEQWAYIAEILAAVAVVPSLVYLAVQVRQGNAQSRATARYAFIESMADINMTIAQDKAAASVWRRGLAAPDELDADERMQLWMFIGQYCNAWVVMYHLHLDGLLPEKQWTLVQTDILSILSSEGGKVFWEMGVHAFEDDFVAFVEGLLRSGRRRYDMLAR